MGYKLIKFNVTPGENEQIDTIIKLPKEPRSVIHGVVLDEHNKPLKDAVVKLLKVKCPEKDHLEPLTHTFTDECGQFLFGPLCPHTKYLIKVWFNHSKTREFIFKADDCDQKPLNCIEHENGHDHAHNHDYMDNHNDEHDDNNYN
jgi:hypothetical protein